MLTVDHGIRGRPLLGEVNHGIGLEALDHAGEEIVIVNVTDKLLDGLSGEFLPDTQPVRKRLNRRQRLRAYFEVPLTPQEIIDDRDRVPLRGQIESRGPATVTITA